MYDLAIAGVDCNMVDALSASVKYEIARAHLIGTDLLSLVRLRAGGVGQVDTCYFSENVGGKSRTIGALIRVCSAPYIRVAKELLSEFNNFLTFCFGSVHNDFFHLLCNGCRNFGNVDISFLIAGMYTSPAAVYHF